MRWNEKLFTAGYQGAVGSGVTTGELIGIMGNLDPGLTIGDFATSVPRVITADTGGKTFVDIGLTDDGTPLPFFLETGLTRSTPNAVTLSVVEHLFRQTNTLQSLVAKIGVSQAGELPVFDTGTLIDIFAAGPYLSQHRQTGKLFAVRLEGLASNRVEWRGADAAYATRGRR